MKAVLPLPVTAVKVKGKFCWIELGPEWFIGITFGMAGGIFYDPTDVILEEYSKKTGKVVTRQEYMKHFHVRFTADDGQVVYYGSTRFGTLVVSQDRTKLNKKTESLGPDLLTGEPITDAEFIEIFRQPKFNKHNICHVLMEQKAVSGIGNYLKAEILYECQINPWANVMDLDDETLTHLHQTCRSLARQAYVGHGASLYTYTGTRREKGSFQNILKVYGKDIDPLGNQVMTIDEHHSPDKRTTHYVPSIQTLGQERDPHFVKKKLVIKLKKKLVIKLKK